MTGVLADERMSDVDTLVWHVERRPRNRTTIAALVRFSGRIDPGALRHRVDHVSRVVPRLRQRVVGDGRGLSTPCWSIDPDFRLSAHLRALRVEGGGDERLAQIVRDLVIQPFDRGRPLWEFTHITGPSDGDALLLKSHHAVSDGVGGVQLMLELFDPVPEAPGSDESRSDLPPPPRPPDPEPAEPSPLVGEVESALAGVRSVLERLDPPASLTEAADVSRRIGEALGSASRMFRPRPAAGVPSARSDALDLRFLSLPLDDLRRAGRRIDGTINDAFVGAVALGVGAYFDTDATSELRVSVPISTRRGTGAVAGNHWTLGRIDVPLGLAADRDALMRAVRTSMRRARAEPAHRLLAPLASGLCRLPAAATATLFDSLGAGLDVAASNVPGSPVPLSLCGRRVDAMIPFGPLSGCAVNATLLSHGETAHIGVASDPAAVADPDRLLGDLRRELDRVVEDSP